MATTASGRGCAAGARPQVTSSWVQRGVVAVRPNHAGAQVSVLEQRGNGLELLKWVSIHDGIAMSVNASTCQYADTKGQAQSDLYGGCRVRTIRIVGPAALNEPQETLFT